MIKPDITAPGLQILAGDSPFPDAGTPPGELFQAIARDVDVEPARGRPLRAPQAGSPGLVGGGGEVGAHDDRPSASVLDNDRRQPGRPVRHGRRVTSEPGGRWGKGSVTSPGLVYDAGLFEYAAFTCGMDWGVFTPDSCDFLDGQRVPSAAVDLNLPSIGISEVAGSQTITRTVTSVTTATPR